jgi:hypothetical protein
VNEELPAPSLQRKTPPQTFERRAVRMSGNSSGQYKLLGMSSRIVTRKVKSAKSSSAFHAKQFALSATSPELVAKRHEQFHFPRAVTACSGKSTGRPREWVYRSQTNVSEEARKRELLVA